MSSWFILRCSLVEQNGIKHDMFVKPSRRRLLVIERALKISRRINAPLKCWLFRLFGGGRFIEAFHTKVLWTVYMRGSCISDAICAGQEESGWWWKKARGCVKNPLASWERERRREHIYSISKIWLPGVKMTGGRGRGHRKIESHCKDEWRN